MAEFRKILVSGSNAEVNELYASSMTGNTGGNVVVWNFADKRFYTTGSYADAGTTPTFPGDYEGDLDLTVASGDGTARQIFIGKDRDTLGAARLVFSTGSNNTGFEILREGSVNGDTIMEQHGTGDVQIVLNGGTTSNINSFKVQRAGITNVTLFEVDSSGKIFMPQLTNVAAGVSLTFNTSNGQLGFSTSTRRVKTDIKPLDKHLLTQFDKLNPVTFKYIADPTTVEGGFIAEEVAEIDPILARWSPNFAIENGQMVLHKPPINDDIVPSNISDRAILAMIVAKIQELDIKINELKQLKQNGSI